MTCHDNSVCCVRGFTKANTVIFLQSIYILWVCSWLTLREDALSWELPEQRVNNLNNTGQSHQGCRQCKRASFPEMNLLHWLGLSDSIHRLFGSNKEEKRFPTFLHAFPDAPWCSVKRVCYPHVFLWYFLLHSDIIKQLFYSRHWR